MQVSRCLPVFGRSSFGILPGRSRPLFSTMGTRPMDLLHSQVHTVTSRPMTVDPASQRSKAMKILLNSDGASSEIEFPGWTFDDCNILTLIRDEVYIRQWRAMVQIEFAREMSKKRGWLDMMSFEKTHLTYFRCISLERLVSLKELDAHGNHPYDYPLKVISELGRMGKTSFQMEHTLFAKSTGDALFKSSLVNVSVDRKTRQVDQNPEWWVNKFKDYAVGAPPLRINFRDVEAPEDRILSRSTHVASVGDVDYYGHVNNMVYYSSFCDSAMLEAVKESRLPTIHTYRALHTSVKRIELDFVGDSDSGDKLDSIIWQDSANEYKYYFHLFKNGKLIYGQSIEFNPSDLSYIKAKY